MTGWPAWIAYYPTARTRRLARRTSTYPWPTWTVWQYADTNWSGGDSDVFNGTVDSLGALVIGGLSASVLLLATGESRAADAGGSVTVSPPPPDGNTPLIINGFQWRRKYFRSNQCHLAL